MPEAPENGDTRVAFVYDYMGRRVKKSVYIHDGAWRLETEKLFVYDGWNLVEEVTTTGATTTSKYYVWGLDLSQSLQGAGGIGGLIAAIDGSVTYHYLYDANGNVGQMVNAADGTIAAHYEYDPFGNEVVARGSEAGNNPFRFSTKYFDFEIGLYYYGYRYFSPELGRWINRDPIEEIGSQKIISAVKFIKIDAEYFDSSINLYALNSNNNFNKIDLLGLKEISSITFHRRHKKWKVVFGKEQGDGYGHWWVKFDGESYGWWPKAPVDTWGTIISVPGELNGQTTFGGSSTRDPHHNDMGAEEQFFARSNTFGGLMYGSGKKKSCKCASDDEIKDCMRKFSHNFKNIHSIWSYPLGPNCHTFQWDMMANCCIIKR